MALLERGKGKRKQVIEIVRRGATLRSQENDGGDLHLPGYCRFSDEKAAGEALAAEVLAHLKDGMQPADEEARAIAARQLSSQKSGPPVLPLRRDLAIYNEATGFVVTSRRMAGKTLDEGSSEWKKAVARGDLLPLQLIQDDPFLIRVVAGGPLTPQEEEEWVARVDWHLNIPDGKLCITGGSVFSNEDYDADDPHHEQYVGEVAVPKGRYRATLYTHVHGVNGGVVLDHLAGGHDKGEPLEKWLARTRPGTERPDWDNLELVEFLVHLEPIAAAPKSGLSTLPADGWFDGSENARKPERCPLGIVGQDIVRQREEGEGGWTYVRDVFEGIRKSLGKAEPGNMQGGLVSLPVESVARAARIAWFASRYTMAELRVKLPSGVSADLGGEWPEEVVAVEEDGVARIQFSADLDMNTILSRLPDLALRLAAMPKGAILDLCCAPIEVMPGSREDTGLLWLRGPIGDGTWRIARAFPAVAAATLEAALSLAAEIERGTTISVRDEEEGNSILAWAKRAFGEHLKSNPPRLEKGSIRFQKAGPEVALLGVAAFAQRFASAWPVTDLAAEEEEDEDEGDGMFPTKPIKGLEILKAPSGRGYYQTMASLISDEVGSRMGKLERGLFGAGFKLVGDLMCDANEDVGVRGYARKDGNTWAYCRVSFPDHIHFELVSSFEQSNAVLVTSQDPRQQDDAASNTFRQGFAGTVPKDLIPHHESRLAELAAKFGPPRPVVSGMKGFAESLEAMALRLCLRN